MYVVLQWILWLFRSPFGQMAAQASAQVIMALGKEGAAILSEYAKRYVVEAEKTYGPGNGEIKFDAVANRLKNVALRESIPQVTWAIDKIAQDAAVALQGTNATIKKEK